MNKGMFILLLLTLLLNGCSLSLLLPDPKPELVYQDSSSDSQPNAVIETGFCAKELLLRFVSLNIWRVNDYNQRELVYRSERYHLCPVVELKPGVYFIAFDVHEKRKGNRRGYGKVVIEAGHRYIFQYDVFGYWRTVWLENADTGELELGSKTPY
jgi:hypothetical protein